MKAAGGDLTSKQAPPLAPHRPRARSARRGGRRHPTADQSERGVFPMRLLSWLSFARTTRKRAAAARLGVEPLEDRAVPATFTVWNLADAGAGSLRAAVTAA